MLAGQAAAKGERKAMGKDHAVRSGEAGDGWGAYPAAGGLSTAQKGSAGKSHAPALSAPLSAAPSGAGQLVNAKTQSLWAVQSTPKVPWQIILPGVFLYELQERTLDFRRSGHDVTAEKNVFRATEVRNHAAGLSHQ